MSLDKPQFVIHALKVRIGRVIRRAQTSRAGEHRRVFPVCRRPVFRLSTLPMSLCATCMRHPAATIPQRDIAILHFEATPVTQAKPTPYPPTVVLSLAILTSLTSAIAGEPDLAGVQIPDFPAIEIGPWFSGTCPGSGSRAHFLAGLITALCAFRALQRTHRRPGIRQLAATVQAHCIAGLVQREWTGLVAVNASKQHFKADSNHRISPSRLGARFVELLGVRPNCRSRSGYGTVHPSRSFRGWAQPNMTSLDLPWSHSNRRLNRDNR
jgi:hypothetical protein